MNIQAIGVCRFSVITTQGFKTGPSDHCERAKYLFAESRMAVRMAWFRHVALASMRAQTDQNFTIVVLASTLMPLKWCDLLLDITKDDQNIDVEFIEPGIHSRVCNRAITSRVKSDTDVIAQFRLDDDDAVARDYISRVYSDFNDYLRPIFPLQQVVNCDYTRGMILDADGSRTDLYTTTAGNWTCGQTVYLPPKAKANLFTWPHFRLNLEVPTLTFNDSLMFLRGKNGENDTNFQINHNMKETSDFAVLDNRFGINLHALQTELRSVP